MNNKYVCTLLIGILWTLGINSCFAGIGPAADGTCLVPHPISPQQAAQNLRVIQMDRLPDSGVAETTLGIRAGLRDPRFRVRLCCVSAVGWLGEDCDAATLEEIASASRDYNMLYAAITSIQSIGFRYGTMDAARVSRLREPARTLFELATNDRQRLDAAILMASLGDGARYSIVLDSLQTLKPGPRVIAVSYLFARLVPARVDGRLIDWTGIIAKILQDQGRPRSQRIDAAISLGELGTPEAERALGDALLSEKDSILTSLLRARVASIRRERSVQPASR